MQDLRPTNAARLPGRIAVYVPGTSGVDAAADTSAYVDAAATLFSKLFGGASAQSVRGYWMSDAAGLVKEETTVIYSFTDAAALESSLPAVLDFCEKMKSELQQEAISLEMQGALYLI